MDCYTLFFNSLISQLFLASISNLLELIQIIFIGFFRHRVLDSDFFRRYIYLIKPLFASVIFLICGFLIYYFRTLILIPILVILLLVVLIFIIFKQRQTMYCETLQI
ncbi:putative viral membrane-associated early morphogenesis protein [Diachasmimorpha longicaudata entomopoxvirus]|uniref:Putative viral membrane-associated early morphogenesis protein n=1 Tax=Diachasmimorpha longicaudata entomopoxvirus TaxID=109981 RepID=A0A7R5WMF2_9POXV|nr:putative viral membrane-associated early morphogenesis protein [Diachasmimorpha longicaudata entomopoxvirus]AKS26354.1 putative viral membrane-associated early morphogenesis protein [Diachasmimorpha longicaudata entomopoxvirus]